MSQNGGNAKRTSRGSAGSGASLGARAQLALWLGIEPEQLAPMPDHAVEVLVALLETSRELLPAKVEELRDDVKRLELLGRLHRDLSMRDSLTGVANRRGLDDRLAQEWDRAARYGHDISVISIDLDGLKTINDCYGHAAGDAVIVAVAHRLVSQVRGTDFVARIGGDEFVVVCPEIGPTAAGAVAAKLTATCQAGAVEVAGGGRVLPQVSAGWATAEGGEGSPTRLLHDADQAMYGVKRERARGEADTIY